MAKNKKNMSTALDSHEPKGGTRIRIGLFLKDNRKLTIAEKRGVLDLIHAWYSMDVGYDLVHDALRIDAKIKPGCRRGENGKREPGVWMRIREEDGRVWLREFFSAGVKPVGSKGYQMQKFIMSHCHIILADEHFQPCVFDEHENRPMWIFRPQYIGRKFFRWVRCPS